MTTSHHFSHYQDHGPDEPRDRPADRPADRHPDLRSDHRDVLLREALRAELPAARELRRELHADPRVSGQEGPTLERVLRALPDGPIEHVAGTGALVRIGGPGPAVGVRGELDALPLAERTGVPWAAVNGAMHACGHDVHLAAVVALARAVARVTAVLAARDAAPAAGYESVADHEPPGPLMVVLQPREESHPSGAADVVRSGALSSNDVRAMIGAHVQPVLAAGVTACTPGAVNASADEFRVTLKGVDGHAAYPHLARDPVVAMAQVIVAAQQLVSRVADPMVPTVVTFGSVHAGTAPNAIPGEAVARGTLRTLSPSWRETLHAQFAGLVGDVARAHGCEAEVQVLPGEPVLVNDAALAMRTGELLRANGRAVSDDLRSCGGDDFAQYGELMPSLMMFVGVDTRAGLHSPEFLPGDEAVDEVAESLLAGYLAASCDGLSAGP
ncbi:M20 family metallopeptidase [Nonomuraea sp. MCN248]|uniref:M20 family metallopeptidase n=1 Tax=Nonomuraea corallina TaxID=2989783 RepID=A0ABT4SBD7_9ACTN|nr:M20 family metallopeptidase [Nonomuraea corallina]MDA0634494.1 M20 family metallopeptidase [Nonomuraea corallina]